MDMIQERFIMSRQESEQIQERNGVDLALGVLPKLDKIVFDACRF